jgi:predicted dehydrogenase
MAEPGQPLKLYTLEGRSWQHFDIPIYFPRNQEAVVQPFIDCLLQDTAPPVTAADGKRALKVILAAYQSAREGRLVEI